jgi:hypothetical protein
MIDSERRNHAHDFLQKAEDNLLMAHQAEETQLWTPAAGLAIHAGINAKDAIAVAFTGGTTKHWDHARAADELRSILIGHVEQSRAERALRELLAVKNDVEYTRKQIGEAKVRGLVRRAETLVELARSMT